MICESSMVKRWKDGVKCLDKTGMNIIKNVVVVGIEIGMVQG